MEVEQQQLLDRLQQVRAQGSNGPSFKPLLAEASKMRQTQDDGIRYEEQKRSQLQNLAAAKRRLQQRRRILDVIASCEGRHIDSVFEELEKKYHDYVVDLESRVWQQRHKMETLLLQTEKETDVDLDFLVEQSAQLEDTLIQKQDELERMGGGAQNLTKLSEIRKVCAYHEYEGRPLFCYLNPR